ncbi:hypothetical protein RJ639_011214 [Escallonia herrerae]|uniref:Clu domain-containing protein n=1 Tax=Escallonia herrerae TaxID=1293975 RepID=A0AA89AP56_9ASTE|nr:hypothetical protein RJ639_011214 [Escallonia herrerae]
MIACLNDMVKMLVRSLSAGADRPVPAYVIFDGKIKGVFSSWAEVAFNTQGYKNAKFKKYPTLEEALREASTYLVKPYYITPRLQERLAKMPSSSGSKPEDFNAQGYESKIEELERHIQQLKATYQALLEEREMLEDKNLALERKVNNFLIGADTKMALKDEVLRPMMKEEFGQATSYVPPEVSNKEVSMADFFAGVEIEDKTIMAKPSSSTSLAPVHGQKSKKKKKTTTTAPTVPSGVPSNVRPEDPEDKDKMSPPTSPMKETYVHNNIFFSFAVDADLEQLSAKQASDTSVKIEKTSKILSHGAATVRDNGNRLPHSDVEDQNGVTDSVPDVPTETQLAESEQATYASANNDLKGTRAYLEADVPGLYSLAMAMIDYRGHRVVAQSVLPGILQGDKSDSLLYGSVDNGKKICWNESFHSKVLEASKRLHLKEHTVLDGSGCVFKLAAPVECKGIVGSDDRHYLLDLMRVTPRDANYTGPGSRFCILRPELINAFCQVEAAERSNSRCKLSESPPVASDSQAVDDVEDAETSAAMPTSQRQYFLVLLSQDMKKEVEGEGVDNYVTTPADTAKEILFNPNVFTEFKLAGSQEEIAADEENVRKVSLYLRDVVIPKFIHDLCTLEVSPMDGQTLTEALHAHGINVRYIGKVADGTKHLPHLWDLCSNEIVVRSAKHMLKDILRDSEDHDLAPAIARFFNCFFGNGQAVANSAQSIAHKVKKDFVLDPAVPQASGNFSRGHARWKSGGSARRKQSAYTHLTSDSLWSDILEFAKFKYQFEVPADARSRVKKISVIRNLCQKVGVTIAARKYDLEALLPFQTLDILNLQPSVKHSIPVCSEAKDLVETGKVQLAEGMLSEAYTLFSEAFTILQQVTGPMHREVANCCRYLAMVLYHAGDMAGAIMQQHKELIINERCLGLDHPDTAHSYGNMALFYHGLNQTELALRHMSRALILLSLSSGPDHPDVAATYINHEKRTYDILVKQLGKDDSRTRDSETWINTFKKRELQMNEQKQKGQALNAASAQKAIDHLLKVRPELKHALQAANVAGGSGSTSASANKSAVNAAIIGETLPQGRGISERVRKKAAARGLLVHRAAPVQQPLPPLSQLLDLINSIPDVANNDTKGVKKEVNGHPSNVQGDAQSVDAQEDGSKQGQHDQTPVGLGTSLASHPRSRKQNPN